MNEQTKRMAVTRAAKIPAPPLASNDDKYDGAQASAYEMEGRAPQARETTNRVYDDANGPLRERNNKEHEARDNVESAAAPSPDASPSEVPGADDALACPIPMD